MLHILEAKIFVWYLLHFGTPILIYFSVFLVLFCRSTLPQTPDDEAPPLPPKVCLDYLSIYKTFSAHGYLYEGFISARGKKMAKLRWCTHKSTVLEVINEQFQDEWLKNAWGIWNASFQENGYIEPNSALVYRKIQIVDILMTAW